MISIEFSDVTKLARDTMFAANNATQRNAQIARQYGQIMQFNVRTHASGYPGPEVITGEYRRSISLDFQASGPTASSTVYTPLPQGYRLEFGYTGVDSLGRVTQSAPFPHFIPALNMSVPVWEEALASAMHRAIYRGTV